jgi:hypothetical protein
MRHNILNMPRNICMGPNIQFMPCNLSIMLRNILIISCNISMPRNIVVCRLCAAVLSAEKQQRAYCPMSAGVAGFVLAYHDSPRRCCLWIDVTPTEGEFPSPTAYIMAALLYKQNFCSHCSRERGGQILTLQ